MAHKPPLKPSFSRQANSTVDTRGVRKLDVAKKRAASLAFILGCATFPLSMSCIGSLRCLFQMLNFRDVKILRLCPVVFLGFHHLSLSQVLSGVCICTIQVYPIDVMVKSLLPEKHQHIRSFIFWMLHTIWTCRAKPSIWRCRAKPSGLRYF